MKKIILPAITLMTLLILPNISAQHLPMQKLPLLKGTELQSVEKDLPVAILREASTRRANQFSVLILSGDSKGKKQTAARYLAQKTQTDIYRVDLSVLLSANKVETAKSLREVFDSVKTKGAVLYLDEGDALFGKRSSVKDAHDRYDNESTNYFLQLVEEYRCSIIISVSARNNINPLLFEKFVRISI